MNTLEQFLNYLQFERKHSKHTQTAYHSDLLQFAKILAPQNQNFFSLENIQKIEYKDVRKWLKVLHSRKLNPNSIQRKIVSLKAFFQYQIKVQNLQCNPTKKLLSIKRPKRVPCFVPEKDMHLLLESMKWNTEFEQVRNQLIIEFLYSSGLRRSELLNLKVQDIQLDKQLARVVGKRNKVRIVPFNSSTQKAIVRYLEYCKNHGIPVQDTLLVRKNGKPMYDKLIYRIVHNALLKFTKLNKNSPHILRHTFATHLLDRGAEIDAVKEILGHSSLAATQIYTHNTLSRLKSIHKQAHPKS